VEKPGEAAVRCKVTHATVRESSVTLALAAGVPRDTVAAMRGATVLIERDQTRVRPVYQPADLVGLNVVTRAGETVGTVRDVIGSRANDVMEIETPDRRRLLLPVIAQVIVSVEPGAGRLVVNDIAPYVVDDAD
jgi:16S rRNA processing protein RimM